MQAIETIPLFRTRTIAEPEPQAKEQATASNDRPPLPPDKERYAYKIAPGSPLFFSAPDASLYKRWLWAKMDEQTGETNVVAELFEIVNGLWLDGDVHVDGPFASVVMAAARYLLKRHKPQAL